MPLAQLHSSRSFFYYLDCTLRMQVFFVFSKQENNSSRNPFKAFPFTSFLLHGRVNMPLIAVQTALLGQY